MSKCVSVLTAMVIFAIWAVPPAIAQASSASGKSSHKMHKMKMSSHEVMSHRSMRHGKTNQKPKRSGAMGHGGNSARH